MQPQTEGTYSQEWLLHEESPEYNRDNVIITSGEGQLPGGRILGRVTAGGKYKAWDSTASDGSQTVAGVLLNNVDATSADAPAVLVSGRVVALDSKITSKVGGQLAAGKTALTTPTATWAPFKLRASVSM